MIIGPFFGHITNIGYMCPSSSPHLVSVLAEVYIAGIGISALLMMSEEGPSIMR